MTGTKRTSPESDASTRPSKIPKTDTSQSTKGAPKKGRKRGAKPSISAETFNSSASPLHVIITHTPPTDADSETEVASVDPAFIGNLTLAPITFSTGSFGWKGSERIAIEVPSSDRDHKEKVQVMLTINATVIGSKRAQADKTNDAVEKEEPNNESKED